MAWDNLHKSIREVAKDTEDNLRKIVPKRSGKLANSVNSEASDDGFFIEALEYISYIDQGVNGTENSYGSKFSFKDKMPPANNFKAPTMSGQFAIAHSIFKKGIRPQNFLSKLEYNFDKIAEGMSKDIIEQSNNNLNG